MGMSKNNHFLAQQHIQSDATLANVIPILLGHAQNHVQAIHSAARIRPSTPPPKDVQPSPLKTTQLKPNPRRQGQHYLGPYRHSTTCLLQNTNPEEMVRILMQQGAIEKQNNDSEYDNSVQHGTIGKSSLLLYSSTPIELLSKAKPSPPSHIIHYLQIIRHP